jgi:glycosyltransferase involved in cell wall biosynthesis
MKPYLLYALHCGQLYGTERMSLATAAGLATDFNPVVFAPPGPALDEARRLGLGAVEFNGTLDLARRSRRYFARNEPISCVATSLTQSVVFCGWAGITRANASHVHVVHGGADETLSYGRKRWLLSTPVQFVAVSPYVRERLQAHGVPAGRIHVIENFLPAAQVASVPRRAPFSEAGIRRVAVVSRVDPVKQVGLLIEALEIAPHLGELAFEIYGSGSELAQLSARAASHPSICFHGFVPDVPQRMVAADLLLHLCPTEPFGLAILEAVAANVPVLVPAAGGAGSLITAGVSGFTFAPNDARALATMLATLRDVSAATLNRITSAARQTLNVRFAEANRLRDYRRLLYPDAAREAA